MTANLHCGIPVHSALLADVLAFSRGHLTGYQVTETDEGEPDLIEIRKCVLCDMDISRRIGAGIRARLAQARAGNDIAMIGWCRAALTGDPVAVQVWRDRVAIERLMGGWR